MVVSLNPPCDKIRSVQHLSDKVLPDVCFDITASPYCTCNPAPKNPVNLRVVPRVTVAVVLRMLGISLRVIPHAADAADCCSEHERWMGIVCGGSCEEDLQQIAQLCGTLAAGGKAVGCARQCA